MKILIVGDFYCPASEFRAAFASLSEWNDVRFVDVVDDPDWVPSSPSERRLKEYTGTPRQLIDAIDGCEILVVQGATVTDAVLDAAPQLRLIACARGGPVNVDLAATAARRIPVVTTPGKNADAVAELTVALMVILARRLPEVIRHVEGGGEFGHDNYEGARWFGHDLAGHTLGVVGFGQIGRRVAHRARAFEMDVVVADPYVDPDTIEAAGCRPVAFDRLLETADFVTLHVRATVGDGILLGRTEIGTMKPGVILINTARESLVDEAALIDGLGAGRFAGVGLDVATPSPRTGRHPLLAFSNVVITTHIGGATFETLHHGAEMVAAEVERLIAGEPLLNVVEVAEPGAVIAG